MTTLLFVCTGNTCRSPLAVAAWEAFGAPLLCRTPYEGTIRAASAGLAAVGGIPISPHAAAIARDWGIDIARHRARTLTPQFAARVDWGLGMTSAHRDALRMYLPQPDRARLLREFSHAQGGEEEGRLARLFGSADKTGWGDSLSIVDPIGGSREAYASCAAQIRAGIEGLARTIASGTLFSAL